MTDDDLKLNRPKRKRAGKYDPPSKTKPKGTPVSGRQKSSLFGQPGGNIPGMTSETAKLRHRNAEIAARLSNNILTALDQIVSDAMSREVPQEAVDALTTQALALMKDSMDREYGKAGDKLDVTSNGETVGPRVINIVAATQDDAPKDD